MKNIGIVPHIPIEKNPEYLRDLEKVGRWHHEERSCGLQIGETYARWLEDLRYSRKLNPRTIAVHLKKQTGVERSRRQIADYVAAYREHRLHVQHGLDFPHLSASHLAQIASSRCKSEAERLELARRVNDEKVAVRRIKSLATSLHSETHRQGRRYELVLAEARVRCMDGLDLIREQADGSVDVVICDWQWSYDEPWSQYAGLPRLAHSGDAVEHLIMCLEASVAKLVPCGVILVHYRPSAFLPPRIQEAVDRLGLRDAGEHVWAKPCGGFQDRATPLMPGHEKTILLGRKDTIIKSCGGGVSSVSPRWAAPTRANSGAQRYHPHQKPVELYETLIGVGTVNGLVVDVFAGSGSAGVAAVRLGCPYVGAELVAEYVEIANRRIALAKGEADAVERAANLFLRDADATDAATIQRALSHDGLICRDTHAKGEAA